MRTTATFPGNQFRRSILNLIVLLASISVLGITAKAQSEAVLYSFQCGPADGRYPQGALVLDTSGDLYGTTSGGGAYELGTVFELSATGSETVLHSFAGSPNDGANPNGGQATDPAGNLYGTTVAGGRGGVGTAWKLSPGGSESVLHSFSLVGGEFPDGGLIRDAAGHLYGTASEGGGGNNWGTVFEVFPSNVEVKLYSFGGSGDGQFPLGTLVRDASGNLYGTTQKGGAHGAGTVFKVPPGGGENVLYSFGGGQSGSQPYAGLVRDSSGNLFGTTGFGGGNDLGTVFELNLRGRHKVLHSFTGPPDGANSTAGLALDPAGNLYGTSLYGGSGLCKIGTHVGCGVVFEVTAEGQESVLYSFNGSPDGANPGAPVILDSNGDLYGTTSNGGAYGCGTVFKFTP